jgi:hypothetical protein
MSVNGIRGIVISCALATQWMLSERLLAASEGLATYSVLLTGYLTFEIWYQKLRSQGLLLVTPPVLTSLASFVIPFAASNILFSLPEETLATVGIPSTVTSSMNDLMLLVVLGACCLWVGYGSSLGRDLSQRLQRNRLLRQLISSSVRVNGPTLCICIGLSLSARLLEFELRVQGYSSDRDRLIELAPYREYLTLVGSLGTWALIAVALHRFQLRQPTPRDRQLLWWLLGYEVVWGCLSGFKSVAILPLILVALASYVQQGRFPRWFAPALVAVFLAVYAVIEPYRASWNEGAVDGSLRGVSSAIISAATTGSAPDTGALTALRVLGRVNWTYVGSLGIEYAAEGDLPPGSPDFLANIFWSPAHAIVPRLLWDTKPLQEVGLWYTRQVVGQDSLSSTAMSGVTYLNFAGGALAVAGGFLLVGFVQRALFDGLRVLGPGGWLVILGLLPTVVVFESAFDTFPVGIIRLLPVLTIAQYFLFRGIARSETLPRLGAQRSHRGPGRPGGRRSRHPLAARGARDARHRE